MAGGALVNIPPSSACLPQPTLSLLPCDSHWLFFGRRNLLTPSGILAGGGGGGGAVALEPTTTPGCRHDAAILLTHCWAAAPSHATPPCRHAATLPRRHAIAPPQVTEIPRERGPGNTSQEVPRGYLASTEFTALGLVIAGSCCVSLGSYDPGRARVAPVGSLGMRMCGRARKRATSESDADVSQDDPQAQRLQGWVRYCKSGRQHGDRVARTCVGHLAAGHTSGRQGPMRPDPGDGGKPCTGPSLDLLAGRTADCSTRGPGPLAIRCAGR